MKKLTIRDVASSLNMSVSTISRALNDRHDIKKETRELILRKVKKMGFHPNRIARNLTTRETGNIGVIVPEFIHPFFHEVILGMQKVLHKEGYQLIIMQSNECQRNELAIIRNLLNNRIVDGFIISQARDCEEGDPYQHLLGKDIPLVLFNRAQENVHAHKVLFDDFKWAGIATQHLIDTGRKKIFHLGGYPGVNLSEKRKAGFQHALWKNYLDHGRQAIFETGFYTAESESVVQQLVDSGNLPEAFFCINDPVAIGAIKTLKRNGVSVPGDVAVVGFTETNMVDVIEPSLTSVAQPTFQMGVQAARLLLSRLRHPGWTERETVVLDGTLNIRDSSGVGEPSGVRGASGVWSVSKTDFSRPVLPGKVQAG